MNVLKDNNLLAGFEKYEDAAVYRLNDKQALIFTLDVITPIVDDPYTFGQIAAANALSDIFAMGGNPLLALNIVAFPEDRVDDLGLILKGGADKVAEAGALLVGGHTIKDKEPKYGLAVVGLIHPQNIIYNDTPQEGDLLILTKPLGTGILSTALKANIAEPDTVKKAIFWMAKLNQLPKELLKLSIHGLTDITGFGLIGHLSEMLTKNKLGAELWINDIPVIDGLDKYISSGMIPGGTLKNKEIYSCSVETKQDIPSEKEIILYDAQTSGGLLLSISPEQAEKAKELLFQKGFTSSQVIGKVIKVSSGKKIRII
ncbi:MAG TPA: selenide, water dikinase SelD [Candidatus Atribacteria bacterium]|nr:selenide, water dikinase SelD [Candidatus Atribacteria bacterium]HBY56320.1 selenide, water dikinase SelD [Candidatus Atribacteria bacterium]